MVGVVWSHHNLDHSICMICHRMERMEKAYCLALILM